MPDYTWVVWLSTPDFIHGTYLKLYPDGKVERITIRADEGDDVFLVKGSHNEQRD